MGSYMMYKAFTEASRKLPDIISEAELQSIISATKKSNHKLAFALGFYQAMRVSEIVKLQPENIDIASKLIMIKESKGAKDRNIPIAPQVYKSLKVFQPVRCGVRALEIAFKKKAKHVLGRDMHFHELRHSGLTFYAIDKKWDTLSLMRFAGHSNANVTSIYYHVKPQQLVDKMWELQ